jgi:hypothetical protein
MSPKTIATIATIAATLAGAILIARKLITRHQKPKPEYITRPEFHQAMEATRNRIGASYLALSEKIDTNHKQLVSAISRQAETFERRIDQLESNLARVDERTLR